MCVPLPMRLPSKVGGGCRWTSDASRIAGLGAFLRFAGVEHRYIHVVELLRFHIFGNDGIDFFVGRPDIFQGGFRGRLKCRVRRFQYRNGCCLPARRQRPTGAKRGKACFAYGWMRPSRFAVARQYGGGVQIAVDNFFLDFDPARRSCRYRWCRRGDDTEAEFFPFQATNLLLSNRFRLLLNPGQTKISPKVCVSIKTVGIACQERGGDNVARIGSIGTGSNRSNNHCSVRHLARLKALRKASPALLPNQIDGGKTRVRLLGPAILRVTLLKSNFNTRG